MEPAPTEDPGCGNRPLGVLALATAAVYQNFPPSYCILRLLGQVERVYKMYATGDFIESGEQFDAISCGPATAQFMDYIVNDLRENQWNSIFGLLSTFTRQTLKEEATRNSAPKEPRERVPLPPSDPPSPHHDD